MDILGMIVELEESRPPCFDCGYKYSGASWLGKCYACHNGSLVPYQSGEDYVGWRDM